MILGIDAFNIHTGGCVTHLVEVLRVVEPKFYGFDQVVVWGSSSTLSKIDERKWLIKCNEPLLDKSLPYRLFWHKFKSRKLAISVGCDILYVPGGSDANGFTPIVTMSQNMLPFEWKELRRYGWSFSALKLLLIRWTQIGSFKNADGVIFLTNYARNAVLRLTGKIQGEVKIIPHGISNRFKSPPRSQCSLNSFTNNRPCRILYVSATYVYKHQWQVVRAIAKLREKGIPVVLDLVGAPADGTTLLSEALTEVDPENKFIYVHGSVAYDKLNEIYFSADIGVFASSCENMPNILIENMAAGLPIACSNMGPMPEILGSAGVYFDPCNVSDIEEAIGSLIRSAELRSLVSTLAFNKSNEYSWERCADETFSFLAAIARRKLK